MSAPQDASATSPSLDESPNRRAAVTELIDAAPDADERSDNASEHGDEDLGDLGGEAEDGDDTNPHKFIERSLHYQDMLMTKRHCEERVRFFEEFAKSMPKGKDPHKKIKLYKLRVTAADSRITKFKSKYASKRAESAKSRSERISKAREDKASEEQLGKPLKSIISKELKKKQNVAQKAAIEAVKALGGEADEKAILSAGIAAFSKAFLQTLSEEPLEAPQAEVAA